MPVRAVLRPMSAHPEQQAAPRRLCRQAGAPPARLRAMCGVRAGGAERTLWERGRRAPRAECRNVFFSFAHGVAALASIRQRVTRGAACVKWHPNQVAKGRRWLVRRCEAGRCGETGGVHAVQEVWEGSVCRRRCTGEVGRVVCVECSGWEGSRWWGEAGSGRRQEGRPAHQKQSRARPARPPAEVAIGMVCRGSGVVCRGDGQFRERALFEKAEERPHNCLSPPEFNREGKEWRKEECEACSRHAVHAAQ